MRGARPGATTDSLSSSPFLTAVPLLANFIALSSKRLLIGLNGCAPAVTPPSLALCSFSTKRRVRYPRSCWPCALPCAVGRPLGGRLTQSDRREGAAPPSRVARFFAAVIQERRRDWLPLRCGRSVQAL